MRIALAHELRAAVPGCFITITTPYPELDADAYACDKVMHCSRRSKFGAINLILRALLWNVFSRGKRRWPDRFLNSELRAYLESDVVIDLSGDGLTEEYGPKCLISHLVPIIVGELLRRPVFVCAQTIGPFTRMERIIRYILRCADRVTAREKLTLNYLSGLGLKPPQTTLTADMAFLVPAVPKEKAMDILQKEGVPLDKPLVGLSISRLPGHMLGSWDMDHPTNLENEMAEVLRRIVQMGVRPIFVSHTTGPGPKRDDRVAAARVAKFSGCERDISVLQGDYSAEEVKGVIAQTELFIGLRMHSCIGALSMGIPTVCIAYGRKAHGIMGLTGQERWVMDITDITADRLSALVREAWLNREQMRASLAKEMPVVLGMARQNLQIVSDLLGEGGTTSGREDTVFAAI